MYVWWDRNHSRLTHRNNIFARARQTSSHPAGARRRLRVRVQKQIFMSSDKTRESVATHKI